MKRVVFCVSTFALTSIACEADEPSVIARANEIEHTSTPAPRNNLTTSGKATLDDGERAPVGGSRASQLAKPQDRVLALEDLPAPSADALERIRSEHLTPTSVSTWSPDNEWAISRMAGADAKPPTARRKTPTGTLIMGPVKAYDSWLFGEMRRTTLRWEPPGDEIAWERSFQLGRMCEMGWSIDAFSLEDRIYVVTFDSPTRERGSLPSMPLRHGPCQGKVTITLLEQNTGDIINTATIPRTPIGARFSHDGAGHIALHERWTYLPGNQCDDGPCTQRIEKMFVFDEATLARTHYFEEVGAFE